MPKPNNGGTEVPERGAEARAEGVESGEGRRSPFSI